MRKRKFVGGFLALCLALSVAGCGKSSEEQQAVNYYQDELGLDKEDAEELAHELYGKDEEEPSVTEAPEKTVVEPLPELVNSEWYDRKVQIYDMVFTDDHMTEEDIRKIVEGSAYDVELPEIFDKNGEVSFRDLKVNGTLAAQFWARNYSSEDAAKEGLPNAGVYYYLGYGFSHSQDTWYDKASVEFRDLKTRDDVLAYLADNGFVEVEKEQAPYIESITKGENRIVPDETLAKYTDTPHYYCTGAQYITLFRMHKLSETDGGHLNLVNFVTFEFKTDGTLDLSGTDDYSYYSDAALGRHYGDSLLGWYVPGYYTMAFTRKIEIAGEKIN